MYKPEGKTRLISSTAHLVVEIGWILEAAELPCSNKSFLFYPEPKATTWPL